MDKYQISILCNGSSYLSTIFFITDICYYCWCVFNKVDELEVFYNLGDMKNLLSFQTKFNPTNLINGYLVE